MKPLQVRPISKGYKPGYPRFEEVTDWQNLIRSSNRSIFAPSTLVFAGLVGSGFWTAAMADPDEPLAKPLKCSNEHAAKIANTALDEVASTGHWYKGSKEVELQEIGSNPKAVQPEIRISFGNSYVGVFDLVRAKKVTQEVFSAYGINLKPNYTIARDGIEFQADGYDPEKKIGFEIVGSDNPPGGFGEETAKPNTDPAQALSPEEALKLQKLVAEGKETMFLVPVEAYPNMDGDQFTPLRSYLRSVLDYLDWLKKEGKI